MSALIPSGGRFNRPTRSPYKHVYTLEVYTLEAAKGKAADHLAPNAWQAKVRAASQVLNSRQIFYVHYSTLSTNETA